MNKFRRTISAFSSIALIALLLAPLSVAQDATYKEIITVEGVTEYQLPNGLKVLLLPDQSLDNIYVNVTYFVGSADEGYGETGMAHFLEHLVFKGSPDHPDIPAELTLYGASANGSTWLDRTNYYETFAALPGYLDWALDLEADRMINSFVSPEDHKSEKTVVVNELDRGENNPGRILSQRVRSVAYDWHNYANSTIGAKADVENVPNSRMKKFYRKWYQPDNAILIVAGKIDPEETMDLVVEKFGSIPRPDRTGELEIYRNYSHEPPQDGERMVTLERVGEQQQVRYAWHTPGVSHPDTPALSLLSHVLSGAGTNSRIYKNITEKRLAISAYSYQENFKFPSLYWFGADVKSEDSVADVEAAWEEILAEIKANPPTDEEMERAHLDWSNSYKDRAPETLQLAGQLGEWAAKGDWRLYYLYRDRVAAVTAEDVQRVAQKYLQNSNRTRGYFVPVEETPERVAIGRVDDIYSLVANYQGKEAIQKGEDFDSTPANIAARTEYRTMSNGARVALLSKKNTGESVALGANMRWGTEETLMNLGYVASFTSSMMSRGTTKRDKKEISDAFDFLRLGGGVSVGLTGGSVSASTIRENLVEAIKLLGEIAKEPAFLEDEFELLKRNTLANLAPQKLEPNALASRKLSRHMYEYPKGHPNYRSTIDEDIEGFSAVTLDQVKDFYKNFAGFGPHTTITVVGDFDPDIVMETLEAEFGDWTTSAEYEYIGEDHQVRAPINEKINTPDKASGVFIAQSNFSFTDDHPDYEAMIVASQIYGGGFLNSRLANRIRQQEGLSYGVGGGFSTSVWSDRGTMYAQASAAPYNLDRVETAFKEEVIRIIEEGFTDKEVEDTKDSILARRKMSRSNDGSMANMLQHGMFFEREMSHFQEIDDNIAALTTEQVNAAFRQHVNVEDFTIIKAGDFSMEEVAQPVEETTEESGE